MDSNFRAFGLAPVTWNILGYSLFCERREKWRVVSRKFQKKKKLWPLMKRHFFYPSDLVNNKTTIPLRVSEERWIYTSTLRDSVYIHHYLPPLRGIVVYYLKSLLFGSAAHVIAGLALTNASYENLCYVQETQREIVQYSSSASSSRIQSIRRIFF